MANEADLQGFEAYLIEKELSKSTKACYLHAVKLYFEYAKSMDKINIINWKNMLLETLSPKTVNLYLSGVRKYCEYKETYLSVKQVKIQRTTTVENVMTIGQYNKLIEGLKRDGADDWVMYYTILAKTGARISEFIKMKKADLNAGYAEMHTKGKVRRILFPAALRDQAKRHYKNLKSGECLCRNKYGQPMTARGFALMLKSHAQKYGIPEENAHPHSFRHLFAIEFLKRNKNISLLADLLGHSGVNTTMIYLRLSQEQQADELNEAMNW